MQNLKQIAKLIKNTNSEAKIVDFFKELLTASEIETLSKRWQILRMLTDGYTQRDISKELKVSLCKVTRGSRILKSKKSILRNYFKKELKNVN